MRDQIWASLNDTKYKGYCLGFLVDKFQKWDRNINIFLAIASSTSIAAWAIWKVNPMVWAAIIAFSQVLTAIKPYIPYFKYVKELNTKSLKVDLLNIEFERLWYKLQHKKVTNEQAVEIYFDLRRQSTEIFNFGDDIIFEVKSKIEKRANERMKTFLKNNYGIAININK
ncbi:MAG: hypothetical protein IPP32_03235 [Bacteroidetes bacterium]|nr:hypothetical protein [Bacteroidota bacterium]